MLGAAGFFAPEMALWASGVDELTRAGNAKTLGCRLMCFEFVPFVFLFPRHVTLSLRYYYRSQGGIKKPDTRSVRPHLSTTGDLGLTVCTLC